MNEINQEVIKDLADDFNRKVAEILFNIDELKQFLSIEVNAISIIQLNERIHALYSKLYPKMLPEERRNQKRLINELSQIQFWYWGLCDGRGKRLNPPQKTLIGDKINPYFALLEERELHLNEVMERCGLTNKPKEEDIKY